MCQAESIRTTFANDNVAGEVATNPEENTGQALIVKKKYLLDSCPRSGGLPQS
ncbi:hypothetical protein ACFLX3_04995 [Chloroflexota bacterium]